MSFRDEPLSSSDEDGVTTKGCLLSGMNRLHDNSVNDDDDDDSVNEHVFSEKETFDNSSDENTTNSGFDHVHDSKRNKKVGKQSKSKVKIKTLTIDGQLVYFCKICDKIFTRRKDKLNHELAHSGESVLACTECGKEYLHESSLASHMRTHAGDPLFMCDLCPKMFAQSHHLKTHILSHSEPTNFVCKTCYIEFPTSSDLSLHSRVQSKLEMTKYWCKMCKVFFCRNHKLICDKRLHAFCCSACNELFGTHKKLKIHVKKFAHYSLDKPKYIEPLQEHELYPDKLQDSLKKLQAQKENDFVRKPLKNDLNGKRHNDQDAEVPVKRFKLSVRKLILDGDQSSTSVQDSAPEASREFQIELKSPTKHRKGKPYCKKCNKSFKDSVDLDRHKALVHGDKQDSFTCEICSMGFPSKDDLDRHGFKHSGERIHTCPVCGQEFLNSLQLTKHLRIHIGDFPYKCSQCGKAFRLKIQLIQHVRLHIAQDNKPAEKCPQSLSAGKEHSDHGHHGEADTFKCHLCSKTFYFRYKLLNHLRLHTNVKCFQCYVCHKTFATKCYLQRHLQVHVKQGMDVDVQNIIVDDDSKSQMDSVGEQITRDNFRNGDSICNHHRLEKEDLKKPIVGIKRSISNFELMGRVKDYCRTSWDKRCNDSENLAVSCGNIKVEVQDDIDSVSEHSFCSSFTRDSERSDPFKVSSDESYTFKTTMAKERRRLKRRWRKSQGLFIKSNLQAFTQLKNNVLNSEIISSERGEDHEGNITDMMIELNTVRSEHEDVTTVYVNLAHKMSTSLTKSNISCAAEIDSSLKDCTTLPKFELNVKNELEDENENDPETLELISNELINKHQNADQTTRNGKRLMFEFNVEQLIDDDSKLFSDQDNNMASNEYQNKHQVCEEQKGETKTEIDKTKMELKQSGTKNKNSSPHSLSQSSKKSPLKFITPDSNLTSESSNLEKLQAVFEHSSKYLPLPEISSIRRCPTFDPSEAQNNAASSTKENEVKSYTEYHSHDIAFSYNSYLEDNQLTSVSQEAGDRQMPVVSSLGAQNSVFPDVKQRGIRTSDCTIIKVMNTGHDSRTVSLPIVSVSEQSSRSKSTTSESSSGKKYGRIIPALIAPKEGTTNKDRHMHAGSSVPSSYVCSSMTSSDVGSSVSSSYVCSSVTSSVVGNSVPSSYVCSSVTSSDVGSSVSSSHIGSYIPSSYVGTSVTSSHLGASVPSFHVFPDTDNCHFSKSLMSQTLDTTTVAHHTTQPLSHSSSGLIAPIPSSVANTFNYYPVFGNTGTDLGNFQPGLSLHPSSILSMNLNPIFGAIGTRDFRTDNIAMSSGYATDHMTAVGPFGNCLISANPLVTTNCVTDLNTSANQSFQFSVNQDCLSLNQSAIFDSNNPVYRDMNMMDLFNTRPSTECNQSMAATNLDFLRQGNLEAQMRHNVTSHMETQSAVVQPHNPFMNLGNPTLGVSLGNYPLSNFINQAVIPMNYGHFDNSVLQIRPGVVGGGEDSLMHTRNMYGSLYRDDVTLGNNALPQLSMHIGNFEGQVPMNVANIFPVNTGNFSNLNPIRTDSFNAPVPVNLANFGGPSVTNTGLPPFNQASFQYDYPFSIPTNPHLMNNLSNSMGSNPHLMNNLSNSMGAFSTPGLQDSLSNLIASSGMNLLNPSVVPQNSSGVLPGSSLGFINSFNTGFFPRL